MCLETGICQNIFGLQYNLILDFTILSNVCNLKKKLAILLDVTGNYTSSKLSDSQRLTGVKCTATGSAKNARFFRNIYIQVSGVRSCLTRVGSHSRQSWSNRGSDTDCQCQTVRKLNEVLFHTSTGQVCHVPEFPNSSQYIDSIRQKQQPMIRSNGCS